MDVTQSPRDHLDLLAGYLAADPENLALLADCAEAALAADDVGAAADYYARRDAIDPLTGAAANVAGVAAMRAGRLEQAEAWFERAIAEGEDADPAVRFNIAWCRALGRNFAGAAAVLNDETIAALPQAAMLDMQIDHQLGRFEEAEAKLTSYLERFPNYGPLNAAASMLAMDVDRPELARAAAEKGGTHPDALATLGMLDLGEQKLEQARAQLTQSLATRPHNPRAEIGLGLVALSEGNLADACARLDRGAKQFGSHLGSWIGAGWAHVLAGDNAAARQRFETALALDDNFGEAQGSLAVIEIMEGDVEAAKRRAAVGRRLDPHAFSGALAAMLIEQSEGNAEAARRIFELASSRPILPSGATLMDELVRALGKS
jgi:Tfp pilus assembly protein PilF